MALLQELEKQGNWLFKYRSYLPIVLLPLELLMLYYQMNSVNLLFIKAVSNWHTYTFICLLVGLLGLAIRAFTVGHTPANTSGRNTTQGQVADEVNKTGLYSMVRHPLYLGNYFMWLAVAMMTASPLFVIAFSLAYWVYYERIMVAEEQFLCRKFGTEYTNWANNTPAFIPKPSNYKKPKYPFSWRKVAKKEKNGLLALCLLLLLMSLVVSRSLKWAVGTDWLMVSLTIASAIAYIVLKVLKKKHLLDEPGR